MKISKQRLNQIIQEEVEYAQSLKEAHGIDEEGSMAKRQLMAAGKAAYEMLDMLDDDDQLPSWLQSKITLASDYLEKAHRYMQGNERGTFQGVPRNDERGVFPGVQPDDPRLKK